VISGDGVEVSYYRDSHDPTPPTATHNLTADTLEFSAMKEVT
jgi:hypothetical protein